MSDTKNDNATVESSNKDAVTEEKFNEQAYLLYQHESLIKSNLNKNYKNFVQLIGHPSILLSKLLGTGVDAFFSITPAQLSLLHPRLRLFKTIINKSGKETDVEIPFNETLDNRELENVLKSNKGKGAGIGLKSCEWEDTGQNPGETGKAFSTTLVMVFASIRDIYRKFDPDASYADLIRFSPSSREDNASNGSIQTLFNDASFRIKAQIGWQVPKENGSNPIINKEMLEALENSFITLSLTLVSHNIKISQEGTVVITANYIGAIEGKMLSPETDILYVGSDFETRLNNIKNSLKRKKSLLKYTKNRLEREQKNRLTDSHDVKELQEQQERVEKQVAEDTESRDSIVRENKLQSYSNLLRLIQSRSRLFAIDVDEADVQRFNELKSKEFDPDLEPAELQREKIETYKNYRQQFKAVKASALGANQSTIDSAFLKSDDIAGGVVGKSKEDNAKALEEPKKKFSEASVPQSSKTHRINFVYFGDLVDAALQSLYRLVDEPQHNIDPAITAYKRASIENFRFLLGTAEIHDFDKDEPATVSLCDIPISLNLFNIWFLKKVIEPAKEKYLLRDFLRDICSELIVKALSPSGMGTFSKAKRNKVSFSVFSLRKDGANPLHRSQEIRGNNRVDIEKIEQNNLKSFHIKPENTFQYLMLYISGLPSRRLRGNREDDLKNYGIPHFYIGADRGLVKNIEFEKVNMQYIAESRIVNSDQVKKGDAFFSEPYNAKLNLIGTPHFKPGMMIYVDPASVGFPEGIPKREAIPIGGYYTITKVFSKIEAGKFETNVDANFEAFGDAELDTSGHTTVAGTSPDESVPIDSNNVLP